MHSFDIRGINFGQIQCFLRVVDYCSFTEAAGHLHLAQSTVSKHVANLEALLGIQLFIRERKKIRPTPAGRYLYEQWSELAIQVEAAAEEAHVIQTGYSSNLSVGGLDSYRPDLFILPTVEAFQKQCPGIRVQVDNGPVQELRRRLIDRELDVAFTVLYDIEQLGYEEWECVPLGECQLAASMLRDNPLAQRETLSVTDLATANFIAISPLHSPSYTAMLRALCAPYGFTPNFTCLTSNANALTLNLITDNDVFICDQYYRDYDSPHISSIPIRDTKSGYVLCWNKQNRKKEVPQFVNFALEFLKDKHS